MTETPNPATANPAADSFDQWAVVELMGHQQTVGRVTEAQFPAGFVRIDVFDTDPGPEGKDASPVFTRVVAPSAVYAINPVSREIAIGLSKRWTPRPVAAYEIRQLGPADENAIADAIEADIDDYDPTIDPDHAAFDEYPDDEGIPFSL
ncbi:MAG: hypothetical protein AAGI91_12920 [Bacteroidota bacterium]